MLRALSTLRASCTGWLRASSTDAASAAAASIPKVPVAAEIVEETSAAEESDNTQLLQRMNYNLEAIKALKMDQYPFYVEREWWKKGKRMTFWATWRQLRDVNRREVLEEHGPQRMRLKALKSNTVLPQAIRDAAAEDLHNMPKYSRPRLILNMCMFTGRQRGKIKKYRVNRHLFRKFADHSQLSGVTRSMW